MEECIFCGIASRKIPSEIVYEDESCIAFLDINPRSLGMTIVAPKKHFANPEENEEESRKVFDVCLKVCKLIKKALNPKFFEISVLPSRFQHFHVRIYPIFDEEKPLVEGAPLTIEREKLKEIAERIRKVKIEEKEEKVKEEVEREEVDWSWLKRELQIT